MRYMSVIHLDSIVRGAHLLYHSDQPGGGWSMTKNQNRLSGGRPADDNRCCRAVTQIVMTPRRIITELNLACATTQ